MIMLSEKGESTVWINPELVESVGHSDYYKGTVIIMNGTAEGESPIVVKESPEDVARKIMDYKIGEIQYRVYLSDDTRRKHWDRCKDAAHFLKQLAGLDKQ